MGREQRPLRTLAIYVDEGDDIDHLRAAFDLGADAVFFDLEDHVPRHKVANARVNIRKILDERGSEKTIFVRVNRMGAPELLDDLDAMVCPELYAVALPKIEKVEEVLILDRLLTLFERKKGMEEGSVKILPLLETAHSLRSAYDVALASPRIVHMGACVNQHGDPVRSIGYQWTRDMEESLYIRQKVLIDARAAGVRYPMSGLWNPTNDDEGLENFAVKTRNIGYYGMMVMPLPGHIEIVNRVFTPAQEEINYWAEIARIMDEANPDVAPDLVVGGQVVPANRRSWADIRLALGAAYGVVPSADRPVLVADHIGKASENFRKAAERA
ncbi:HpcH/HpaI aldolase/citrate lyase family protein [Rhizorhabdus dicambivorans]|uniref:HpcH/HpaI aldolase/citrate lyase domain-containing protein n=1 Tax=Rhizorhabdus dicambivorans TaxID=1850238 RepID=A0A2A4G0K5_9SPHN|nr:aldolase/citrate lyase family protein [Rhizorhabdus dicambivorans]ATE66520.1 hypothetical protein CMV14_20640 [Rhizorhabdus dicambivorans]PCE43998.1 hypothetical protein COO09_03510 [Rhizorhabdus dicambivorans]